MTAISDNHEFIFYGHRNGKVFRYNKKDYKSDLFLEFEEVVDYIKVS